MRRLASCLLVLGLALVAAGCGASKKTVVYNDFGSVHGSNATMTVPKGIRVGPGPFILFGSTTGGQSGLSGDGGDGPNGTSIGCLNGRRYTDAIGLQNSTGKPLTLVSASLTNPDATIVARTAVQIRLSPPYHPTALSVDDLVQQAWSTKPSRPVTIPPHRIATVQRDFLLRNCHELEGGKGITIPGSLVLHYRRSGHAGRQALTVPGDKLAVVPGPIRHVCAPVSGSAYLVATDVSCAFARRAAPLCRGMKNGGWASCTVDGMFWDCGRFSGPGFPLSETCYLPHQKSHWFSVTWVAPGLGLWGAIQNRHANIGWRRLDAWHVTRGICEDRPAGMPFVFESSALRILSGRYAARVPTDARVRFVLHEYRGRGRWSVNGTTVEVLIGRHGRTIGTYVGGDGRLTILHVDNGSVSGTVYANLRQRNGTKQAELNGTWSCRVGTG